MPEFSRLFAVFLQISVPKLRAGSHSLCNFTERERATVLAVLLK